MHDFVHRRKRLGGGHRDRRYNYALPHLMYMYPHLPYYGYHPFMMHPPYNPIVHSAAPLEHHECLKDGQSRGVVFLDQNCAGFPLGETCCNRSDAHVTCHHNIGGGMSVGTLECRKGLDD